MIFSCASPPSRHPGHARRMPARRKKRAVNVAKEAKEKKEDEQDAPGNDEAENGKRKEGEE